MGLLNCPRRHKTGVGEKADGNKAGRSEGVGRGRGAVNERVNSKQSAGMKILKGGGWSLINNEQGEANRR